ncbi:MAG: Uma2 family endonuclease [Candidatus Parcubacteria bacterium]|nr:Uma2 family endonuclease [Leptolyngbyaceae cyanobacterium LF-bin-113]
MYDLPSEDPEEPGLPDEFHDLQPQLLSATLRLVDYSRDRVFTGSDLNLYYDVHHPLWHKRPDWFLALGVSRLYEGIDLRSSYVIWQEGTSPFVVVELLSPGTEKEDLGQNAELPSASESESPAAETPPRKWDVYEKILRVPYYVVFSRYTNQMRVFQLVGSDYQEQPIDPDRPRFWFNGLKLGLGLWHGEFDGITRSWLRWYDAQDNWLLTDAERVEQAEAQLRQTALNLLQSGMSIEQVAQLTGFSEERLRTIGSI